MQRPVILPFMTASDKKCSGASVAESRARVSPACQRPKIAALVWFNFATSAIPWFWSRVVV